MFFLSFFCSGLSAFEPHFATDPAISPDGNQVCFSYKGDLWTVSFKGGIAKRLTSTESAEFSPTWSPDGKTIAFSSNREGQTWAYIIPSTGGAAKPMFKEAFTVIDWFLDNDHLLCSKNNLSWGTSLYKAPLNRKKPKLIAEIGDSFSSLSPDNDKIIFNRYGEAYREAYRGSKNGDLWEYNISQEKYTRLTNTDLTERYPAYSFSSNTIFFSASDGYRYQLYKAKNGDFTNIEKLTNFDTWSVRDISIARQNDRIVFELFDEIWCYDPSKLLSDKAYKLPIEISEDDWRELNEDQILKDTFNQYAVSDDNLLIAFSYKYDLFMMPRKGGEVKQITMNQNGVENIAFLTDNRTIVFSQYLNGIENLYKTRVDSIMSIEQVEWYGKDNFNVDNFYRSSDKHWVIEYTDSTGGGRIAVADSSFENIKPIIVDKYVSTNFAFSPDGTMAIYATLRDDIYIREMYLYDFITNESKKIMNDDAWVHGFTWLPDQKSILLSKSNNDRKIYRLDLVPRDEFELDIDNWKEIFKVETKITMKDSTSAHDKPFLKGKKDKIKSIPLSYSQVNWYQIDKRLSPIVSDPDYLYTAKAIDDTSFYYIKMTRGKDAKAIVYRTNIYGKNTNEIGSFKSDYNYQILDDNILYYKDDSKLKSFNLKSKVKTDINNEFRYNYNRQLLNEKVFDQVWGIFGRNFYDPTMHNNNWSVLYTRFKPYLKYADASNVLEIIIEEMIGEINASHTGYYPRSESKVAYKASAYLGLEFNQRNILPVGLEVSKIYQGSVLYNFYGIREGDILMSIDGTRITQYISTDSLLSEKADKKIDLLFKHNNKDVKATVKGLNWSANRELWFEDMMEKRRSKTDALSNNRIGYVLIPRMSGTEYANFISDIFTYNADKDALIIDIRGNVGGRIHNDLLDFLTKKPNAFTTGRRYGSEMRVTPGRTWTKPIVLLIDENSFSDAEIFPQLFKEAKLGTVIGMPTSGSVIGTWEVSLLDGSSMRMPGSGWYRLDGTNMEGNGAQPDIRVEMSPEDIIQDNDLQLKKAVEVLLDKIK